jgi:CBS domain-containing protein
MTIGEICTRKVIVAPRTTSVYKAAKLMREHHTGDVVVTDDDDGSRKPAGIVTDRDLVLEIMAQGVDPAGLSVGEVMSANPVTVRERDGVFEAVASMRAAGVRRTPVVDSDGALVGIVSLDDVLELMAEELGNLANTVRQEKLHEIESRK